MNTAKQLRNSQSAAVLQRHIAILDAVLAGHRSAKAIALAIGSKVRTVNADLLQLERKVAVQRWRLAGMPPTGRFIKATSRTIRVREQLVNELTLDDSLWTPRQWVHPIRAAALGLRRSA